MVIGAIAAWRASRKENAAEDRSGTWRDDSLDDWRKERARQADEERATRATGESQVSNGRAEEQATEKKHQRIGG